MHFQIAISGKFKGEHRKGAGAPPIDLMHLKASEHFA